MKINEFDVLMLGTTWRGVYFHREINSILCVVKTVIFFITSGSMMMRRSFIMSPSIIYGHFLYFFIEATSLVRTTASSSEPIAVAHVNNCYIFRISCVK